MYEFEDDKEVIPEQVSMKTGEPRDWSSILVQVIGVILLLTGLWAAIHVLLEAMRLYRDPVRIEQLALAIERGSNLDNTLRQNFIDTGDEDDDSRLSSNGSPAPPAGGVHLSYFVAWIIALFILMLISMIAMATIRAGAGLLLQGRKEQEIERQSES